MTVSTADLQALARSDDENTRRLATELLDCREQLRILALGWEGVRAKLDRAQSRGDTHSAVVELDAIVERARRRALGDEPIGRRVEIRASQAGLIERMFAQGGKHVRSGKNASVVAWIGTGTGTHHERARVEGDIVEVHAKPGDRVDVGALLATIEPGPERIDDE